MSKSVGSTDLVNMKRRMYRLANETKTDLKRAVYRNHKILIEVATEATLLESEVYQFYSLLADMKEPLNTIKELLIPAYKVRRTSFRTQKPAGRFVKHAETERVYIVLLSSKFIS